MEWRFIATDHVQVKVFSNKPDGYGKVTLTYPWYNQEDCDLIIVSTTKEYLRSFTERSITIGTGG